MSITALTLLLFSAILHAGWNLIGKRNAPEAAAFLVASMVGVFCLAPFPIWYREAIGLFSPKTWLLVFGAGFFQAFYYTSLAGAYRSGDMSIAYPIARSSPVIVVTVVSVLLGRGDQVSWQCIGGIALVVAGGFLLPMQRFDDFHVRNYLNLSCLLALAAAFGTTGYSIVDDEALRLLRQTQGTPAAAWQVTGVYAFFEALTTVIWLAVIVLGRKRERTALRAVIFERMGSGVAMGVAIHLTYLLVLVSMAFVNNVSYVVAFRQISIPLGVLMGVLVLKEPGHHPKFVGVTIMFAGLLLVGKG
jgi:drug/metabolite transporter (DMT)-like permease